MMEQSHVNIEDTLSKEPIQVSGGEMLQITLNNKWHTLDTFKP